MILNVDFIEIAIGIDIDPLTPFFDSDSDPDFGLYYSNSCWTKYLIEQSTCQYVVIYFNYIISKLVKTDVGLKGWNNHILWTITKYGNYLAIHCVFPINQHNESEVKCRDRVCLIKPRRSQRKQSFIFLIPSCTSW